MSLKWKDVAMPGDKRIDNCERFKLAANIAEAKTGKNQFVPVLDPLVVNLMVYYRIYISKGLELFPNLSYEQYNAAFKSAAHFFNLGGNPFSTHSARIGAALHAFCNREAPADIALRGRWKSMKSLQYYLENGRAWLMKLHVPKEASLKMEQFYHTLKVFNSQTYTNLSEIIAANQIPSHRAAQNCITM